MSDDKIFIVLLLIMGAFLILPYMHLLGWRMELESVMDHSWALMFILIIILVVFMAISAGLILSLKKQSASTAGHGEEAFRAGYVKGLMSAEY